MIMMMMTMVRNEAAVEEEEEEEEGQMGLTTLSNPSIFRLCQWAQLDSGIH
jgi:hypothetical protein